jgi:TPR repeat protein
MYMNGQGGLAKDNAQAMIWYRKAADAGVALAMNNLGFMYQNGRGVAKDDAQAVIWYRKAAEMGNEIAKGNLQKMGG